MNVHRVLVAVVASVFTAVSGCSETIELGGECVPGTTECTDCADNDGDGRVDGADAECTGGRDDSEGSFATGSVPDDENDGEQDCYFDGNAGSGDDDCELHPCCLIELDGGVCPAEYQPPAFDPGSCVASSTCIEACVPLTPPGCDCFGCCTVCVGAGCVDILISPVFSPDCSEENLGDADACTRCVKNADCETACDPAACVLCPGQDSGDLPASCD